MEYFTDTEYEKLWQLHLASKRGDYSGCVVIKRKCPLAEQIKALAASGEKTREKVMADVFNRAVL